MLFRSHDEFGQRQEAGAGPRRSVCCVEIWYELFERDRASLDSRASRRIMNALRKLPGWTEIRPKRGVYGLQKTFVREGESCVQPVEKAVENRARE